MAFMHCSFWHRPFWFHAVLRPSLLSAGNSFGVSAEHARSGVYCTTNSSPVIENVFAKLLRLEKLIK
jgi:hypothetical protein